MHFVIYGYKYSAIAFLLRLCYIQAMVKEANQTHTSHNKSELDKFRIFYEMITPPEKRGSQKTSTRPQRHSRQTTGR